MKIFEAFFGENNPVFYMRGRRLFSGRQYFNRTDYPFHFNRDRESSEIEARYTLYMYEELLAIRRACECLGLGRRDVEAIFFDNADRLIRRCLSLPRDNWGVEVENGIGRATSR
jgi:hypothetical protein